MKPKQEDPKEMVGGCCVCSDENGWTENPLVYCDGQGCNVAVHQACYGIVTVPTGAWFCRKCESQERAARVRCELCPSKDGALKRTDSGGWAHVVCALYIPEVRFGNVTTMEPIMLQLIPQERFNKSCYLCDESQRGSKANIGACMQCNRAGCKNHFHVTCAQSMGLLCEEAGNYMDNVKYCGYCQYHYNKLRRGSHVKTIPPYRPVPHDTLSSDEDKASSSADFKDIKLKKRSHKSSLIDESTKQLGREVKVALDDLSGTSKSGINTSVSSSVSESSEEPSVSSDFSVSLIHSPGVKTTEPKASTIKLQPSSLSGLNVASNLVSPSTSSSLKSSTTTSSIGPSESKTNALTTVTFPTSSLSLMSVSLPSSTSTPVITTEPSTSGSLTITAQSSAPSIVSSTSATVTTSAPTITESISAPASSSVLTAVSVASKMKTISSTSSAELANVSAPHVALSVSLSTTSAAEKEKEKQRKLRRSLPRSGNSNTSDGAAISLESFDHSSKEGVLAISEEKNLGAEKDTKGHAKGHHSSPEGGKLNVQFTPNVSSQSHKASADSFHTFNSDVVMSEPVKRPRSSSQDRGRRSKRGASCSGTGGSAAKRGRASVASRETAKDTRSSRDSSPDDPPAQESAAPKRSRAAAKSEPKDSKESLSSVITNGLGANTTLLLGNQINPASAVAQKMTDTLHAELEAHSIYKEEEKVNTSLVGPSLPGKKEPSTPGGALSTGQPPPLPQSLEQLLERQWEQGSQFLMEQAQHFDIASLLSCLHQLRQENARLEESVTSLVARRDHLLAVNARLSVPLSATQSSSAANSSQTSASTPPSSSAPTTPSAPTTTAALVSVTPANPLAIIGAHITQATASALNQGSRVHVQQRHPSGGNSHSSITNPQGNIIGRGTSPHDRRAPHQGPIIENGLGEPEYRYRSPSSDHQHRQQSPMLPPGAQPSPTLRQSPASSSYHSSPSPHAHTGVPQLSPSGVGSAPHALVAHSTAGGAGISMNRGPAEQHSRADLVRHSNPAPGVAYPVYQMVSPPIPGSHHSPVGMAQHPQHSQVLRREVVDSSRGSHQIEKR